MKTRISNFRPRRGPVAGFTLGEIMVAIGVGGVVLGVVAVLTIYSLRSFTALGNYTDLDSRSRGALDEMSRDIRKATAVTAFQNTGSARFLTLTNATDGTWVRYVWNPGTGYLTAERGNQSAKLLLSGCERWDFSLQQRTPIPNTTNLFYPATNAAGATDLTVCKQINMTWKCTRQVLGKNINTESVQTAKVVLRNKH